MSPRQIALGQITLGRSSRPIRIADGQGRPSRPPIIRRSGHRSGRRPGLFHSSHPGMGRARARLGRERIFGRLGYQSPPKRLGRVRTGSTRRCRRGQMERARARDQRLAAGAVSKCRETCVCMEIPAQAEDTTGHGQPSRHGSSPERSSGKRPGTGLRTAPCQRRWRAPGAWPRRRRA